MGSITQPLARGPGGEILDSRHSELLISQASQLEKSLYIMVPDLRATMHASFYLTDQSWGCGINDELAFVSLEFYCTKDLAEHTNSR